MARKAGVPQRAFNGGEQSPLLESRADLARWLSALDTCENFITLVQGGLTRRSGFRDVYAAQANSRLIEFAFSGSDGYAIEFAPDPGKIHFFRDYGILLNAGVPYEVVCPFTAPEIANLDFAPRADRIYFTCGSKPIQQMQRVANTNWTIAAAPIINGPFRDPNLDMTVSLSCGGAGEIPAGTAGLTITAAAGTPFVAAHVGALFRVRVKDESKYGKWKNQTSYAVNDIVVWNGNWYKCTATNGISTGENPPVHLYGESWDGTLVGAGANAAKWLYLHSGFGIIQVTGYTSPTVITANALTYVPADLRSGTWRWEEGAWSDYRGYPLHIGFHKKRLYAASNAAQPTRVWASEIDNYTGFDDSNTDADKAFSFDLEADSGEVNQPQWLVSGKKLALGTSHNEFVIGSADVTSPITPTSVDPESQTNEGSGAVLAIKVNNPVFVSKDLKRIHELAVDPNTGDLTTTDLTIEAEHITGSGNVGVTRLTWLRDPYRLLVALRSDGVLITACYRKDQAVIGWHRHPMAGSVLDICRAPSPSGIRQDLWAKVQYVLPSGTVTRIQSLMPFFERTDLASSSAWFVDCGFQYSGAPATTIDLIPAFLIGATVGIRADGKDITRQVVAAGGTGGTGKIVLDAAASIVTLGLPIPSRGKTLRYDQRLQGRNARVSSMTADVIRSGPVYARADGAADFELLRGKGDAAVDQPEVLTNGLLEVPLASGWSDDGNIEIFADHTGPVTIRALTPHLQVA